MPISIVSGPDWATIMTAFGTVGAVVAAVGIAIASSKKTSRLVAEERGAADCRVEKQFRKAEELEQRSQAVSVEVLSFSIKAGRTLRRQPWNSPARAMVIVINKGKYAIVNLNARLSPDGASIVDFSMTTDETDLRAASSEFGEEVVGTLAAPRHGTLAAGARRAFLGDEQTIKKLSSYFPIVRWVDYWGDCWEYRQGDVYQTAIDAPWLAARIQNPIGKFEQSTTPI